MTYTTTILEVGPEASAFLAESMAITFADDVPEALRPYCFLIEKAQLTAGLALRQTVRIGRQGWTITALGDVAEQNLAALGHVTLVFDGGDEPRMPGAIHLAGDHAAPELVLGAPLVFE